MIVGAEGIVKQRKHDRSVLELKVQLRLLTYPADELVDQYVDGTIVDISPEGFSLTTSFPLSAGLFVTVIAPSGHPCPRYGIVRWIRRESGAFRAGLSHIS